MGSIVKPGKVDPLFELVQWCKEDHMPGGRKFIRAVNFDTSPSCVLATDHQLQNLIRFCTNPGAACVMGIDPMFNLGKFYVTVTTFTYSHVINKSTSKSPTFMAQCLFILKRIMIESLVTSEKAHEVACSFCVPLHFTPLLTLFLTLNSSC